MKKFFLISITTLLVSTSTAQVQPGGKVSGLFFADYFYKASGDTTVAGTAGQYSAPMSNDMNGFQLRRMYLTYDHVFSERFVGQITLEAHDKSLDVGGRYAPFVKTMFVEWKNALPMTDIAMGLVPTPTWVWGISERTWGYRMVEKTIADFRSLGLATDYGVSVRGRLDDKGLYSYVATVGNGAGQKPETDRNKKFYGEFLAKFAPEWMAEVYGDYERLNSNQQTATGKAMVAYAVQGFNAGIEAVYQAQLNSATNITKAPFGVSGYASYLVPWAEGQKIFARGDWFDPDLNASNVGYSEMFATLGIDFILQENVHLIPNVWLNQFFVKGTSMKKDPDLALRMTVAAFFR